LHVQSKVNNIKTEIVQQRIGLSVETTPVLIRSPFVHLSKKQTRKKEEITIMSTAPVNESFVPYRVAAHYLSGRLQDAGMPFPSVGVICGSGLSELSNALEGQTLR
jgi:hypothetical protein